MIHEDPQLSPKQILLVINMIIMDMGNTLLLHVCSGLYVCHARLLTLSLSLSLSLYIYIYIYINYM